ncbi:secretin N-terminal domain-containing protein [Pirellulaceae bacterium SH449]
MPFSNGEKHLQKKNLVPRNPTSHLIQPARGESMFPKVLQLIAAIRVRSVQRYWSASVLIAYFAGATAIPLCAQDDPFSGGGVVVVQTADGVQQVVATPDGVGGAVPVGNAPTAQGPGDKAAADGAISGSTPGAAVTASSQSGDSGGAQNASADSSIKRESIPTDPPNKKEFSVSPDEEGMVQFQFRNQEWPDLLMWLADVSNMTLDWQELPTSRVNLSTKRKYTIEEARDLFNRHLLLRGYTMLELESTLQVVKTEGINVSLVPKIPAEMLDSLPPNRFVRTSFPLRTLIAGDVLEGFKSLVSKNGVLTALEATNRLEAMDSAGNLAEIYRMLEREQSDEAVDRLVQEFELEFVRAETVKEQLMSFLGISQSKASASPMSPEEQMMQQQQMMMQQQMLQQQQRGGAPKPPGSENKDIHITANVRRNSVIVHAPPNKMAIVSAFVRRVDVPNENAATLQRIETRMKVYRLASLDPKQLVASIVGMDVLEPTSRIEVDDKNKAIIVYASLSDQLLIQQVIDRLDGSAREMEVIQLRRLRAEDVANTIKFLFGEQPKEETQNNNRYYYDPWSSRKTEEKKSDTFRVAANTQDNQVLIWANDIETKEVYKLLEKLGEIPAKGSKRSNVRVIEASRSQETKEYLERLQEAWSRISDTPLILPNESEFPIEEDEKQSKPEKVAPDAPPEKGNASAGTDDVTEINPERFALRGLLSAFQGPQDDRNSANAGEFEIKSNTSKQGVQIKFDEKGNLVLTGADLDALDQLERMMISNAPPQLGYQVFYLKDARPIWVELNLKDYFKEEEDKKDNGEFFRWYFGFDSADNSKKKEDPGIGKKRKLRFISDPDTSSIVVIGADEKQLKTIKSLIKLWDVPEKPTKQKLRYSKLVKVEFSKAEAIVETMKDAYRDLLSTNDKAFAKGKEDKESKHEGGGESVQSGGAMSFSFTGKLSLGVDRITNSILVSAEGEDLLKLVIEMIKELDQAARPTGSVQMMTVGGTNSAALEKALLALLSKNEPQQANNGQNRGTPGQDSQGNQFPSRGFQGGEGGLFQEGGGSKPR